MDNQNPDLQQMPPTQIVQPTPIIPNPSQTVFDNPPPPGNLTLDKPNYLKDPKFKKIIIIAVVILISFFAIFYVQRRYFLSKVSINKAARVSSFDLNTPFPTLEPLTSGDNSDSVNNCNSPLAPAGVGPFDRCSYRDQKISIIEAQSVLNDIAPGYGIILIPPTLNFSHVENYKGVTIKWTDSQPISDTTLAWVKSAIDILPPYFVKDHPVQAIISVSSDDLGQRFSPESTGAALYQSGLNIFLSSVYAKGSSDQYLVNKETLVQGLFHEWIHVVQNYEILQTFTLKYLFIPGNASVVMGMSPFNISYAKAAGWIFQGGDFGYATLGTDTDAQKQTDYGKTKYIEDMAEAGSFFMLCMNGTISENRIKWWETTTKTDRNVYCPSRI